MTDGSWIVVHILAAVVLTVAAVRFTNAPPAATHHWTEAIHAALR